MTRLEHAKTKWAYYYLADKHLKRIKKYGFRYNVSEDEMEEIAVGAAIATCLKGDIVDDTHANSYFFQQVKFRLYQAAERQAYARFDVDQHKQNHRASEALAVAELNKISSEALPELRCYVGQVLREIDALPIRFRRIMTRLILGYTPLEIATADDVDPKAILADIRTAREWIASKDGTELGDFEWRRRTEKPHGISGAILAAEKERSNR